MSKGRKTLTELFEIHRSDWSAAHKVLWTVIRSYDSGDGCYTSIEKLAECVGVTIRHLQRLRTDLRDKGYLTVEKRGPRPGLWRAVLPTRTDTDVGIRTDVDVGTSGDEPTHEPTREYAPMSGTYKDEYGSEYGLSTDSSLRSESILCDQGLSAGRKFSSLAKLPGRGRARIYPAEFEGAFQALPHRQVSHAKPRAYTAWQRYASRDVEELFQLEEAALAYAGECRSKGTAGSDFVMMASTFFGPGEEWERYSGLPDGHQWTKRKSPSRDQATGIDWDAEAAKAEALAS